MAETMRFIAEAAVPMQRKPRWHAEASIGWAMCAGKRYRRQ